MLTMKIHEATWVLRAMARSFGLLAVLVVAPAVLLFEADPAYAATFTVNRTGDANDANLANAACDANTSQTGNQCTLRAAIQEANDTAGADIVRFNIVSAASVKTIFPTRPLPTITEALTMNGYAQSGASANTLAEGNDAVLKVVLDGSKAGSANGLVIQAANSTIRGLAINRFEGNGILLSGSGATGNNIEGNRIGTNAGGTTAQGNADDGVDVFGADDNSIGGTDVGARNLISGNGGDGVQIVGGLGTTGNEVLGNYIGTNKNGTSALGNSGEGVLVFSVKDNTVGGTANGAGNLISGNQDDGIEITGNLATDNQISGNFVGTDVDGTSDLGNTDDGVEISSGADDNRVGGAASGERNVISGNGGNGVQIIGGLAAKGNEVLGNFVGTSITGNAALGNSGDGVHISQAEDTIIGGTAAAARNVISGNGGDGVVLFGGDATGNKVQGNRIGTNIAGTGDLGNDDGVVISSASDSTIGSDVGSTGGGNLIAFNDQDGVLVFGGLAVGNSVLSNSIHSNGETGIDLGGGTEDSFGVTVNDTDDPDASSSNNHRQNFPVITSAIRSNTNGFTTISGTLNSNPNQAYTIQCFVAGRTTFAAPDPSGHGEGQIPVAQTSATTDANGDDTFSCVSPVPLAGEQVSATATNTSGTASGTSIGDTSEFSQNFGVIPVP